MTTSQAATSESTGPASEGRPPSHLRELVALDELATTLDTAAPGSLVLLYGPSGEDCDAVAEMGANTFAFERRAAMLADGGIYPAAVVDAHFSRDGALDLRILFAMIQARLGAPPTAVQVPGAWSQATAGLWAQGRRQQLREHADYFLAAVNACQGRDTRVVVVTHLGRRGERTVASVPGEGTETLVQFAAAAGVTLVLSGGFEVLDYRTTAAPTTEIYLPRYQPSQQVDRDEFIRVAQLELARLGSGALAASDDVINYLLANSLGSVAVLRGWVGRAVDLKPRLPAHYTSEDVLAQSVPKRPSALKAAAQRIVTVERRLAAESAVSLDDVFAILAGSTSETDRAAKSEASGDANATALETRPNYRDPQTRRPGERSLEHDPVGATDDRVA